MQQHIKEYRMAALCEALAISSSGYYAWLKRPINTYKLALKEAVNICYITHKARVGAPTQGFTKSVHTIGCVMQYLSFRTKSSRKFKCTTDSNDSSAHPPIY